MTSIYVTRVCRKYQSEMLLVDSWSGHKDDLTLARVLPDADITIKLIHPKTIKYVQPLDVYFFRQLKIYVRRIHDFVRCNFETSQTKLHDRMFIMKMFSIVYNQLGAKPFQNMLIYAW